MKLPTPIATGVNITLMRAFDDMLAFLTREIPGKFWLEAGTCLGFYRNGGPIGKDKDVDFGILAEALTSELEEKILKEGKFQIFRRHGVPGIGYEVRFVHENGVRIDWFPFYKGIRKGQPVRYAAAFLDGGHVDLSDAFFMPFPAEMVENHTHYEYKNLNGKATTLPLPTPVEDYLVIRYGKEWRVPNSKWDWRTPYCRDDAFTQETLEGAWD